MAGARVLAVYHAAIGTGAPVSLDECRPELHAATGCDVQTLRGGGEEQLPMGRQVVLGACADRPGSKAPTRTPTSFGSSCPSGYASFWPPAIGYL